MEPEGGGAGGAEASTARPDPADLQASTARPDPADLQATLGSVATGLAEQLSSITEEMNKIRQELYGEQGIGGIATELERLKASGIAGLLDGGTPDGAGRGPGAGAASSGAGPSRTASASTEARRRRTPEQRERELEDLRRRFQERRGDQEPQEPQEPQRKPAGASLSEKLVMLFLVLVCLYIASPFFRSSVKRAVASLIYGMPAEEGEEDEVELVPDY